MAIKIIIDSASDITRAQAAEMGITVIPLTINFGANEYRDGIDLTSEEFYKKLDEEKELPKTSQIPPFVFEETLERVLENDDQAIVITLSSKLSGTYRAAEQAAQKFGERVLVFDSMSAAAGERILCQYALKLVDEGCSALEVCDKLVAVRERVAVFGVLDTLEFLKKGGRISSTVAFVGGLLNLKPVAQLVDGVVKMAGKARGRKKAIALMNQLVLEIGGIDFSMPYGVLWTGGSDESAKKYVEDSVSVFGDDKEVPAHILGSTIGTHVGPGVVGLAFFKKINE